MAKKKEDIFEEQLDNIENNLEALEKIRKEQAKAAKEERKRQKIIEEKQERIREDLKEQLVSQGKFGKHFDDMVEDYIFFVKLKEDLQNDIKIKGLRYRSATGNGYITDKANESVQNLIKTNAQMLKILQDLDLKAPDDGGGGGDDLL